MPLIALDARLTRQMSIGMKIYVRELATRLPRAAPDLQFAIFSNERLSTDQANASFVSVSAFTAANGSIGEQLLYPRQLNSQHPDLIHHMSVYAPRFSRAPHVYTIHDLIHLRFPQYFSWKVPLYYRHVAGPVARSARAVITDAAATVADLGEFLGVQPDCARVIPLGVSEKFVLSDNERTERAERVRARFNIERPYFLYAGNHRPHKNLQTLYAAWSQFVHEPCDLVITQNPSPDLKSLRSERQQWADRAGGKVRLTRHVDVDDLISLYAGCVASIQPSLYEGFGLSVLESMASGAPAVVARTPALLEIGADAVETFPPTDAAALGTIMAKLLTDSEQVRRLRQAGQQRALMFNWEVTARATADVYREALQR
ncbi:MAG TPA: glycosyltransferase family 1 protein [Candidatus Acidoferrales bacterium]|nr:glycosyltransferase family 1 protein [Candidatus Acidoferrales bacterium]